MFDNVATKRKALEATEAKLAQLQKVADDQEDNAILAGRAFETNPGDKTFMEKSVGEQRAKNARAEAERFEEEDLAQAREVLEQAELEAKKTKLKAAAAVVSEKVRKFHNELRQAIAALDEAISERETLDSLSKELGVRWDSDLNKELHSIAGELNEEFGLLPGGAMMSPTRPIEVIAHHQTSRITFKLTRDARGRRLHRPRLVTETSTTDQEDDADPGPAAA